MGGGAFKRPPPPLAGGGKSRGPARRGLRRCSPSSGVLGTPGRLGHVFLWQSIATRAAGRRGDKDVGKRRDQRFST